MKSPIQEFSDELDDLIKNGSSIDAFDLPIDYIENLEVEVICSTYIDNCETEFNGHYYILKTSVENENMEVFCRIISGDDGVLIDRSDFTESTKELLIRSHEGWSYF